MMRLKPGCRLLFIGDSITDCGRQRPIGEGRDDRSLGDGYVSLVNAALTAVYPDYAVHVINMGISGHTVFDLEARWKTDVLDLHPDWLVIKIGINDALRSYNPVGSENRQAAVKAYQDGLDGLIRAMGSSLQGLVLMKPYILEPDCQEPVRAWMDRYGDVVESLARQNGAVLVDSQAAFDHVMAWVEPEDLAPDRIHVTLVGHTILARAFLQAMGFSWERNQEAG